jgi:translation elongation factor P/translation initiation factor 5A
VYGIELLNANAQLTQEDGGQFVLLNEATGEQTKVKLPLS